MRNDGVAVRNNELAVRNDGVVVRNGGVKNDGRELEAIVNSNAGSSDFELCDFRTVNVEQEDQGSFDASWLFKNAKFKEKC